MAEQQLAAMEQALEALEKTLARFAALAYAAGAATIKDAPDYKMGYADGAAVECDKFNKERQQYADWFDEAAADIYDWGGYASEYFQEKYDLEANVQDFRNRAAAIRERSVNAGASSEATLRRNT